MKLSDTHNPIIIKNSADGKTVEINIEGSIGGEYDWWTGERSGATKEALKAELKAIGAIKSDTIIVNINSLGGDVNHGISMHDLLAVNPAKKIVRFNGMTASAATIVGMAGNEREISDNALFLPHKASTGAWGNANEIEAVLEMLKTVDNTLAKIYSKATGKTIEEVLAQMNVNNGNGEWMTSDEAKAFGFVTSVFEPKQMAALVSDDILAKHRLPGIPTDKIKILTINNPKPMKANSKFTALIAAVVAFFPSFKAEDEITNEHLEKVNDAITKQSDNITSLTAAKETAETALATASASLVTANSEKATLVSANGTLTTEKAALQAEVDRLCKLNPGATSVFKTGTDTTGASDYDAIMDSLPHNQEVDKNPLFKK